MNLLITSVKVIEPGSGLNGKKTDILIEDGIIRLGNSSAAKDVETLNGEGLCISPGWFDMRVNYQDPGFEFREGLENGCLTSAAGGFTGVALLPETNPSISGKSQVEYIRKRTQDSIVDVYPMASILQDNGETISEMYDLKSAGAIAFSSGYKSIPDDGLLLRAMQYSSNLDVPLVITPVNKSLYGKGLMNEGIINVQLGMKGIPVIADEIELHKIIILCRYTGAKIHISGISSASSIEIIRNAQKEGLKITTEVSAHHLGFDESDLMNFNTNLKLRPPLRTKEDKEALRSAIAKAEIDCIASDHNPQEEDRKRCEFELAGYGASGTQTLFSQTLASLGEKNIENIIRSIAIRPREILGLHVPQIKDCEIANLTIFDMNKKWTLDEKTNVSKSRNNPMWNAGLSGKAVAIINKNQLRKID